MRLKLTCGETVSRPVACETRLRTSSDAPPLVLGLLASKSKHVGSVSTVGNPDNLLRIAKRKIKCKRRMREEIGEGAAVFK